jgi:hypothetical protein
MFQARDDLAAVAAEAVARCLPNRTLDDRVGAREQQPGMAVVEPHQVRWLASGPVHLYDLAVPVRVPDGVSVNADPVADCRFHVWASLRAKVSYLTQPRTFVSS